MSKKEILKKFFIPVPAHFTFWSPKGGYFQTRHQHRKITDEEINLHIEGKQGLTISPFIDDTRVLFGSIDVDVQDFNLVRTIVHRLEEFNLRGNLFKSKSKGYHLYIFPREPIPAKTMIYTLKRVVTDDIARRDNKIAVEIFPKQERKTEKGGSKVNLPLFGDERQQLPLDGETIREVTISVNDINSFKQPPSRGKMKKGSVLFKNDDSTYPCIKKILQGVEKGSRNVSCLELCRFWVSKGYRSGDIKILLEEWNNKNFPPLSENEMKSTLNSIDRDKCKRAPNCNEPLVKRFCDREHCPRAEIVISNDPKIIRKIDGYYLEKTSNKGEKVAIRATNFVMDVIDADSGTGDVSLRVKKGEEQINVNLSNNKPGWNDFLSGCNYKGVTCDHFGKVKFIVLLGAELSQVKDRIVDTDISKMDFEKIVSMIDDDYDIAEHEKGIELEKQEIRCGWRDKDATYFRPGRFCAKNRIPTRELARIFRRNEIKKSKVRAPTKERTPLDVWVIPRKKLPE